LTQLTHYAATAFLLRVPLCPLSFVAATRERPIHRIDNHIHVFFVDDVRRQEPQNRIVRAVDQDPLAKELAYSAFGLITGFEFDREHQTHAADCFYG
jgi:hypothetical protein